MLNCDIARLWTVLWKRLFETSIDKVVRDLIHPMPNIGIEGAFCELLFGFEAVGTFGHSVFPLVLNAIVSLKSIGFVKSRELHLLVCLWLFNSR